ncbi:MAG: hypothetical protein DSY42_03130, partial [Aquifex sp.]
MSTRLKNVKMWIIKCMLLASVVVAWDPARPGALVEQVGDLIIINESVRVILNFKNVTRISESMSNIENGLKMVKNKIQEMETTTIRSRLANKMNIVEKRLLELHNNFIKTENRSKRAIAAIGAVTLGAFIGITSIGLYTDLRFKVHTLTEEVFKISTIEENVSDIEMTILDITENM